MVKRKMEKEKVRIPREERIGGALILGHLLTTIILVASWGDSGGKSQTYLPLVVSTVYGGAISWTWLWLISADRDCATMAVFFLTPTFTCLLGFQILCSCSPTGFPFLLGGALLWGYVMCNIYAHGGCEFGTRVLYSSMVRTPSQPQLRNVFLFILLFLVAATFCAALSVAAAAGDSITILLILLSLVWTVQVMRNVVFATMASVMYQHFAHGRDIMNPFTAIKQLLNTISIRSILSPVVGAKYMFSYANAWGFVDPEFSTKGFARASGERWEAFQRLGVQVAISHDITAPFCLFSGAAVGVLCSFLVAVPPMFYNHDVAGKPMLAFLIGYCLCRLVMAYPQACVAAYYVAYSEHPESPFFEDLLVVNFIMERQIHISPV